MTVEHLDKIAWPVKGMGIGLISDANGRWIAVTKLILDDCFDSSEQAAEFIATLLNAGHAALTGGESGGWQSERSASWQPIESAPRDGTLIYLDVPKWDEDTPVVAKFSEDEWIEAEWIDMGTEDRLNIPKCCLAGALWHPLPKRREPEPEPDPWALLREMLEVVPPRLGYGMTSAVERVRQALAAHDAREGGGE